MTFVQMRSERRDNRAPIIGQLIAASAALFVAILALAAYWDRSIRVLHVFEALPYLVAAALGFRGRKVGYAVGVASGLFWLFQAGYLVTFVRSGFEVLAASLRSGRIVRPDVLIAVPAALGTAGLVVFSAIGYAARRDKSWRDGGIFAAAFVIVSAFFVAIFAAFAPQFLVPLQRFVGR
jgi:hypothetical protein